MECEVTTYSLETPEFESPEEDKDAEDEQLARPDVSQVTVFPVFTPEDDPRVLGSTYMLNQWARHAYVPAHKGEACVVHTENGFILRDGKRGVPYALDGLAGVTRTWVWHPDCRYVAFWAPRDCERPSRRIALMDTRKQVPGAKPAYSVIYDPGPDVVPVGFEWAPNGKALLLMELSTEETGIYTQIRRIPLTNRKGKGKVLMRTLRRVDFFNSPTTRFEYGAGSVDRPFSIVYGASDGLYVVRGNGEGAPRRLAKVPADNLENIEWNPTKDQFAVYFNRQARQNGTALSGLYLADVKAGAEERLVKLYDFLDVNTLWFSAKGTYVLWSTYPMGVTSALESAIHIVPTDDLNAGITITQEDEQGNMMPITGVYMNPEETKVAYTAFNRVFVYDLRTGKRAQIAEFPYTDRKSPKFAAEPHWVGDRVAVSVYEDIKSKMDRIRNTPVFTTPHQGNEHGELDVLPGAR